MKDAQKWGEAEAEAEEKMHICASAGAVKLRRRDRWMRVRRIKNGGRGLCQRWGVETKKLHSGALPKIMWGLGCHCIWTFERINVMGDKMFACRLLLAPLGVSLYLDF